MGERDSGLTFDPHAFNHAPTSAQNIQVYESLVDFNSDHTHHPWPRGGLAPDRFDHLEFELRQGVTFHAGTLFTAEDAVFSLRRALSPQSESAQALQSIAAVEADGDHVVRVRTTGPPPVLPEQLFTIGIMSRLGRGRSRRRLTPMPRSPMSRTTRMAPARSCCRTTSRRAHGAHEERGLVGLGQVGVAMKLASLLEG